MAAADLIVGVRYPSGTQRWTVSSSRGGPAVPRATSVPSAGYTLIEVTGGTALPGSAKVSFETQSQAQRYMNLVAHGIPPDMAEQLSS